MKRIRTLTSHFGVSTLQNVFNYSLYALPWDFAILLFVISAGMAFLLLFRWMRSNSLSLRDRFLGFAGMGLSMLVFLVLIYGSFIEPQRVTVTEEMVSLPLAPGEELRIVALSDMHTGPYKGSRFFTRVVEKVNALEPDLVLLLGDFVFFRSDPLDSLLPLKDIHSRYGAYAILGNHEYGCFSRSPVERILGKGGDASLPVRRALERSGVTVLRNEWEEIEKEGTPVFLSGVDDLCSKHDDIAAAVPELQRRSASILLAHSPDVILEGEAKRYHLILAGHTHGGQIRLPFIGPVPPLPTQLGRSYDQGLFPIDANTTLAITRGIGESGPRARLFAPPEILLLKAHGIFKSPSI